MKEFSQLKKNLKKDFSHLKNIKVALLGDSATQFLVQAIRGTGFDNEFDLTIWEADFNQIDRQILDPSSELYAFQPQIIILFQSAHKLLGKYYKQANQDQFANNELNRISDHYSLLIERLNSRIIFYNFNEINDSVYGNFCNKTEASFLFQLRKLNLKLMEFSALNQNMFICDLSSIQNQAGKGGFFQPSIYINTEMVLSLDVLPIIAKNTLDIINALEGNFKKCLILDLDNTLWGGVIGDDGLENIQIGSLGIGKAFTEFQYWVKALKNRGVIIAVCSKNTESVAKKPFEKHPDMVLKIEDISVFMANWENKADNIRRIQNILNIGFDSMVFLDDNPFERNMVRENISEICVPEMPEDPADYLEYLYTLNLFETVSVSEADSERTKQYQVEAQRVSVQQNFTNEDEFLKTLNMLSRVEKFNKFNTPRVAQLTQRSNQFNLRTQRYTDSDIESFSKANDYFTFAFNLEDKYGDNGLISVVILKQGKNQILFIDTWLMSCRVLKRGMENFVLNNLVSFAIENGYSELRGEYLASHKNEMVKDHYQNLGFTKKNNYWFLSTKNYENGTTHINRKL